MLNLFSIFKRVLVPRSSGIDASGFLKAYDSLLHQPSVSCIEVTMFLEINSVF